jgi:N-methylhydantoinase A
MDIGSVVLPRSPGVVSARGLLLADVRMDESQAYRGTEPDAETGADVLGEVRERLLGRFREQGFDPDEVAVETTLDMRYRGQSYEVRVPLSEGAFTADSLAAVTERFHDAHARRYGHAMRDEPVELVTVRVSGTIPTAALDATADGAADGPPRTGVRDVYFDGPGFVETAVIDRERLAPGETVAGPAILEESSATAVLPPGAEATVTDRGNVDVEL